MSRLLLQLFDVTHMFGMHLRPELVLLQKTMVQVEGVARALDPHHDMWTASRPIVERWVKRELGPEADTRRAIDEVGHGFAAIRRLPQTLAAIEAPALKVGADPQPSERLKFQWMSFWVGLLSGAVLFLVLTAPTAASVRHSKERGNQSIVCSPAIKKVPTNSPVIPQKAQNKIGYFTGS